MRVPGTPQPKSASALAETFTEAALRAALAQGEFELHFQPKVSLTESRLIGAEALVRWRRAPDELVPPTAFMPVIEGCDLVHPFGRWLLRKAARTLLDWQSRGIRPLPVSVNISAATIAAGDLPREIRAVLDETGLNPALLEIEVLENVLLDEPDAAARQLREIHALGVSIALDDFGTGYSSLNYLRVLPFDSIKIDRTFIADLDHSPASQAVVRAVLSMAHTLSRTVIAEGVETAFQAQHLMRLGCNAIQGLLTGGAMPAGELIGLLDNRHETTLGDMISSLTEPKALLVEHDATQRDALTAQLRAAHWKAIPVTNADAALQVLSAEPIDLLLVDHGLTGDEALDLLEHCRLAHPETIRVMIAASDSPHMILAAINRGGVFRYLLKPIPNDALLDVLADVRALIQRLWRSGIIDAPLDPL